MKPPGSNSAADQYASERHATAVQGEWSPVEHEARRSGRPYHNCAVLNDCHGDFHPMNILNEASEAVIIDCEAHPSLLLLAPEGYWKSVHWVCGNASGSGAECIRRSSDRDRKPARNEGLIAPSTPRRPSRPPFGRRRPQAVHREYRFTGGQGDCARKREPGNPISARRSLRISSSRSNSLSRRQ